MQRYNYDMQYYDYAMQCLSLYPMFPYANCVVSI